MADQLVAPSAAQWRDLQRRVRQPEYAYKPGQEFFGYRDRNRQLLRIKTDEPNSLGYYSAVWLLSDTADASHEEKASVWAWPISGGAADGDYFEGETVGVHEGLPVFRGWSLGDDVPDILRIVTNNCLNDKPAVPAVFRLSEDTVVDDHGQTLIDSTILAGKGAVTFKVSVTWSDPDWTAYTGDHFEFRLIIDGNLQTEVCEHIVLLGGPSAVTVKEFTWHYTNPTKRPIPFLLYAIRTSGFGDLTATTDSKVEVATLSATNRVEYRQLILPKGVKVGPKICVDDPKDCCVDDQSSISSSAYLNIPCCPVPVPSQWKVTFSNVTLSQYGDEILYLVGNASTQRVNWSPLSLKVQNALNATHVLNYVGFEQKTIGGQTYVDCIFEKILSITDPYYETVFDGVRSSVHITNWAQYSADVQPRLTFKIRHLVSTNSLFYNYLIPPTGPVDAPQVAAMATLECHFAYLGPYASGILTSSGTGYYRQYVPHFTGAYHTTQDWPNAQYLEYANTAADFPDPGTSCDGPCKLWSLAEIPGSIHANNGEHPNGAIFPLFNTVEPV